MLAESDFSWQLRGTYELSLQVVGHGLQARIDGALLFDKRDSDRPLDSGTIALVCEEGRMAAGPDRVQPAV